MPTKCLYYLSRLILRATGWSSKVTILTLGQNREVASPKKNLQLTFTLIFMYARCASKRNVSEAHSWTPPRTPSPPPHAQLCKDNCEHQGSVQIIIHQMTPPWPTHPYLPMCPWLERQRLGSLRSRRLWPLTSAGEMNHRVVKQHRLAARFEKCKIKRCCSAVTAAHICQHGTGSTIELFTLSFSSIMWNPCALTNGSLFIFWEHSANAVRSAVLYRNGSERHGS